MPGSGSITPVRSHSRSRFGRMLLVVTSPYYRYRNAKIIHGVRVGFAMLLSILVTTGIGIPSQSGIWASVTTMIVIGGLQHHGNIRKKAFERGMGTLFGSLIGLTLIVMHMMTGFAPLIYVLMSVAAGVCGYYAIGKAGYIALLTAVTMCIVAGHGDNELVTGLWRTGTVAIGIVIALAFSFALPLYATYSWRYGLAGNLRAYARLYARVASGERMAGSLFTRQFAPLGGRLVQLRGMMPSVAKEIDVPVEKLEQIQRLHRALLSSLEMLAEGVGLLDQDAVRQVFAQHGEAGGGAVRAMLLSTARALRFGNNTHALMQSDDMLLTNHDASHEEAAGASGAAGNAIVAGSVGPYWLAQRVAGQVVQLRGLLRETEPYWNIEGGNQEVR